MEKILREIDWMKLIYTIWTVVLLPILTYAGAQIGNYVKAKQLDKYTDLLYKNAKDAVKAVYETTVKETKGTSFWTKEKQTEAKEAAKANTIYALNSFAYQFLKSSNDDFEEYLDSLMETALYDLKNQRNNEA